MKYLFCLLISFCCYGIDNEFQMQQDDDDEVLQRNNHPELEYFRLLQKLTNLNRRINYLQKHYPSDHKELLELQEKSNNIHARLITHEND